MDRAFWALVREAQPADSSLAAGLLTFAARYDVKASVPPQTPVWEREHFASLQAADEQEDWPALCDVLPSFEGHLTPPAVLRASALALDVIAPDRLAEAANRKGDTLSALLLAQALPAVSALRLAVGSSPRFAFAALYVALRGGARELGTEAEARLQSLLSQLAGDPALWLKTMAAFNRYPQRRPALQRALGVILAGASPGACDAYIDSIELSNGSGDAGVQVGQCLDAFRRQATLERRQLVWRRGYERWRAWDFGAAADRHLTTVSRSELDFPAVGWLVEGELRVEEAGVQAILAEVLELERQWFPLHSELGTAHLRLLSRLQIFAHSASIGAGQAGWLPDRHRYLFSDNSATYALGRHASRAVEAWPAPRGGLPLAV